VSTVPTVLVYLVAIVVAIAIVPITHGRFDRLAAIRFERVWLVVLGLALQIGVDLVDLPRARYEDVGVAILLASYVALLAFCASNLRMRGIELIALGIALNAVVIALNLGMPYRAADGIPRETTAKHRPTRDSDLAVFLSDQITIGPPVRAAISVGDIVLAVGIVELAYAGSRRRRGVQRTGRSRRTPPFEASPGRLTTLDLTAGDELDLRDRAGQGAQPTETGASARSGPTTRSSASKTRGS